MCQQRINFAAQLKQNFILVGIILNWVAEKVRSYCWDSVRVKYTIIYNLTDYRLSALVRTTVKIALVPP